MRQLLSILFLCLLLAPGAPGFTIDFDYTYDTTNFYAPASAARASLDAAGALYESLILDDLEEIVPGGGNTWNVLVHDPGDWFSPSLSLVDLVIPADTLLVYVGADSLGAGTLGIASTSEPGWGGSLAWGELVEKRGEVGVTRGGGANETGTWGGTFSVNKDVTWNLDHTAPPGGLDDLYSTIIHELGHILGLGTADSWTSKINLSPTPDSWTGVNAVAAYGGFEPSLDGPSGNAHWDEGVSSTILGGGGPQEAALDPTLTTGDRKLLTLLDAAALDDLGWDIAYPAPEPATLFFLLASAPLLLARRRRG